MIPLVEAYKQAKKICLAANNMAFFIRKATCIKSKLVYYEQICFFYILNDITLNQINYPVSIITLIKDALLKVLAHTNSVDFKKYESVFDTIISFRAKAYLDLLLKYSENITPDFLLEAFNYQSELIVYIQENNNFMDIKQKPCSIIEWIQKAATDDYYKLIVKTFNDNVNIIFDFIENKESLLY